MTAQQPQQTVQNVTNNAKPQPRVLRIFIMCVIISALTSAGYFGLHFILHRIDSSEIKLEEAVTKINRLQTRFEQLQNGIQTLQDEMQKINATKDINWKPAMIEHLVRMADLTLNTTGETKLAITFLAQALQYTNDPTLSAINHVINKDLASLQAVPAINSEELILKLENLNQKIASLPIVVERFTKLQPTDSEETSPAKTIWRRFLAKSLTALKNIVTVRHQTIEPLLLPEQETVLRLNIQTKLLQAELAIINKQNKLYQECLTQIVALLTRYFATSSVVKTDILPTLQELLQIDLQPKLPSLTESLASSLNLANHIGADAAKTPNDKKSLQTAGVKSS